MYGRLTGRDNQLSKLVSTEDQQICLPKPEVEGRVVEAPATVLDYIERLAALSRPAKDINNDNGPLDPSGRGSSLVWAGPTGRKGC